MLTFTKHQVQVQVQASPCLSPFLIRVKRIDEAPLSYFNLLISFTYLYGLIVSGLQKTVILKWRDIHI